MSLAWRINYTNKDSLRASIIQHKYNQQNQISNNHNTPKSSSLAWRSLKLGWSLCKIGLAFLIGDGRTTNFWQDKWCASAPLQTLVEGPFPENVLSKQVSAYLQEGVWQFDSLPFQLPKHLFDTITSLHLPNPPRPDKLIGLLLTMENSVLLLLLNFYIHSTLILAILVTSPGYGNTSELHKESSISFGFAFITASSPDFFFFTDV